MDCYKWLTFGENNINNNNIWKDSKKIITCGNNNKNGCNDDNSSDSDYCMTNVFISVFHERIHFTHQQGGQLCKKNIISLTSTNARYIVQSREWTEKCVNMDKAYLEGRIWKSSQMLDTKDSWKKIICMQYRQKMQTKHTAKTLQVPQSVS